MPEVTETIVQKNKPGPGKKMWELVTETGEKYKAFSTDAILFSEGGYYRFNFEPKEFNGYHFKSVTGPPTLVGERRVLNPTIAISPKPADIGPHAGMWEKRASKLLRSGMSAEAIPSHIILCRRLARSGLQADIDAKLPEPDDSQDDFF